MEGKCVKGLTLKCILQSFLEGKKSYNSAAADFLIMRIVVSGKGNMLQETEGLIGGAVEGRADLDRQ